MINTLKEILWGQFGASIDMLGNAIARYPEDHWEHNKRFFYVAYHCLVFLDYYLSDSPKGFAPGLPYTLVGPDEIPEGAVDDLVPQRIYTKAELMDYLRASRERCRTVIAGLTEEKLHQRWIEEEPGGRDFPILELLLYNMRHVQHHAAQLNLFLRQNGHEAPDWIRHAKDPL